MISVEREGSFEATHVKSQEQMEATASLKEHDASESPQGRRILTES